MSVHSSMQRHRDMSLHMSMHMSRQRHHDMSVHMSIHRYHNMSIHMSHCDRAKKTQSKIVTKNNDEIVEIDPRIVKLKSEMYVAAMFRVSLLGMLGRMGRLIPRRWKGAHK